MSEEDLNANLEETPIIVKDEEEVEDVKIQHGSYKPKKAKDVAKAKAEAERKRKERSKK